MDNDVGFFLEKKYQPIAKRSNTLWKKIATSKKLGIYAVDVLFLNTHEITFAF